MVENIKHIAIAWYLDQKKVHDRNSSLEPTIEAINNKSVLGILVNKLDEKIPNVILLPQNSHLSARLQN